MTVYNQLWDWIENHCPAGMDALNCQACFDYSGMSLLRIDVVVIHFVAYLPVPPCVFSQFAA